MIKNEFFNSLCNTKKLQEMFTVFFTWNSGDNYKFTRIPKKDLWLIRKAVQNSQEASGTEFSLKNTLLVVVSEKK